MDEEPQAYGGDVDYGEEDSPTTQEARWGATSGAFTKELELERCSLRSLQLALTVCSLTGFKIWWPSGRPPAP